MKYTMKMLVSETGVTEQTIRKYIAKYQEEFAPFLDEGGRGKVRTYNEEILNLLRTKMNQNEEVQTPFTPHKTQREIELEATIIVLEQKEKVLTQQVEILMAQLKEKDSQIAKKDTQLDEAHKNTGAALLALAQEQDRIKLLEAPKASVWERLFGKKREDKKNHI